jgi:hypothetical protein
MKIPNWFGPALESPALALIAALVLGALALSGHFSAIATWVLLTAAWIIAIYALHILPSPIVVGVGAILAGCLILLAYWFRPDAVPTYSGILEPRSELLFSPGGGGKIPLVQIGESHVLLGPEGTPGVHPIKLDPIGRLLLPGLEASKFMVEEVNGKVEFSTQINDETGKLIAEISRNEWKVAPPPGTFDRNYSSDALEVRDPKGQVVLQVRVLGDRIQIQGAWALGPEWKPAGAAQVVIRQDPANPSEAQFVFYPSHPAEGVHWPKIRPIFEYPSERHLGEYRRQ